MTLWLYTPAMAEGKRPGATVQLPLMSAVARAIDAHAYLASAEVVGAHTLSRRGTKSTRMPDR